ncbi:MAG: hypothetical protein ACFCU4_00460 [Puniceicoccaceae bacterium]
MKPTQEHAIGVKTSRNLNHPEVAKYFHESIQLKLADLGLPLPEAGLNQELLDLIDPLVSHHRAIHLEAGPSTCPVDERIETFLNNYFSDLGRDQDPLRLPRPALILDRHGIARSLSLPPDADTFESPVATSYRVSQGVLHNPEKDRRTTQGVFHVVEGGLPIPEDKRAVPKNVAYNIFQAAMHAPEELQVLPFTATSPKPAHLHVSLLLRPIVVPEVPGFTPEKSMEVRFFAPGSMTCNLDFVESIFGNAGNPFLPQNDAALDPDHWTGHTGCVVLAPHLIRLRKKELGLPHVKDATERQIRDGMCWEHPDDLYNNGSAFKLTCRDKRGVVFTVIADSYFGYSKKEVKTQISYAANLYGLAEEEHAGGALVFPSYDLGEEFVLSSNIPNLNHTFAETSKLFSDVMDLKPEGYAIDRNFPSIVYLREDVRIFLDNQTIEWNHEGKKQQIRLDPEKTFILPSGYKIRMIKPQEGRRWRLQGTNALGTLCHKPCTVSGGGKSEISKPITDAIISGPVFVSDFKTDFEMVKSVLSYEFGNRFKDPSRNRVNGRPILSPNRSLGSVIKLLTPSKIDYTDAYNSWLESIPQHVKEIVLIIKRLYRPDWGDDWVERFSVDAINGLPGYELRYRRSKLITQYLRIGYTEDGSWRTFGLRKDFLPAAKLSAEDDITASITIPGSALSNQGDDLSRKFVKNCEYRFFQRPDDAVIRGYDKQTELDMAIDGNFFSNYQPLPRSEILNQIADTIRFEQYTAPLAGRLQAFARDTAPAFAVSPANPRLVNGVPTKNPRYLQTRPDLEDPKSVYLAEMGARIYTRTPNSKPYYCPVTAVLPGRRNNPPEPKTGTRPLCCYGPIHYVELPELFMELIASLTGKSPSTTGAGSEGALTKGPFNALLPVHDINNALVSFALTGYPVFVTSAGYIGPKYRVDHDISLLVPELWSRLREGENDPRFMIEEGYLEPVPDIVHNGEKLASSRLGYRITQRFIRVIGGRVFNNPASVFTEDMLRPELQDLDIYADSVRNILEAHEGVAQNYFRDGSIDLACPPIRALLHIMAHGHFEGKDLQSPEIRQLFDRQTIMTSDWYRQRLLNQQEKDVALWSRHLDNLSRINRGDPALLEARRKEAAERLAEVKSEAYLTKLVGTIGLDV